MRIPRIFTTQPLQSQSQLALESSPSAHLAKALRMQAGDALVLFNGEGGQYAATIVALDKRAVTVEVGAHLSVERESPLAIHLGIGVSRGERMDHVIQKSTELGVHSITPLYTQRTEVKLAGPRAAKRLEHWRQVAVSACEQCGRNRVPNISPLLALDAWLPGLEAESRFVLHHDSDLTSLDDQSPPQQLALLVGPEGGLSSDEIGTARQHGFTPLRLGPRIMRTETAPLAALAILQARWGDIAL